jgi:hypothetical protein
MHAHDSFISAALGVHGFKQCKNQKCSNKLKEIQLDCLSSHNGEHQPYLGRGKFSKASSLLLLRLRAVLCKQLKDLLSLSLLKRVGELVDTGGNLEALHENFALALNAHVARPSDVAAEVAALG